MGKICLISDSPELTEHIGCEIGRQLQGGEVIELTSDLGGGKTTLTKGIARGIDSEDVVTSPTFTISKIYRGKKLEIHHYDFYRLGELGLMSEELQEVLKAENAVTVIEWAGAAHDLLPKDKLISIEIIADGKIEFRRKLIFNTPDNLKLELEEFEAIKC